ncbi:GDP-mannose 4,6-dehydratase [bacterium]|jgi:dTDP-glucose 4,6-dehydratase|nr:GDP-mannose 4,6-dehydratase [bacterium]
MKHVFITGAAGFIGSHICDLLLKKGYAVSGIDNFITGSKKNLAEALKNKNFQFLEWDTCEPIPEKKFKFFKKHKLFGVFHFACPASPVDFAKIPFEILAVDSLGTMRTVDLAMKYKARYIVASTSEIYGDPLEHPQKEDYWGNVNTIGPRACYDETKRFAEAYVSTAARGVMKGNKVGKQLNARIVRIFNTYGPRMRPNDGRVVPELLVQAMSGKPLTVHGEGKQTRSFCYVSDLVDGIVRLFESDFKQPCNIGNPTENTILEFAQAVNKAVGSSSPIQHLPAREDDPRRRCPDITRAKTHLGWSPKVGLDEGLRHTLEDFKKQLKVK